MEIAKIYVHPEVFRFFLLDFNLETALLFKPGGGGVFIKKEKLLDLTRTKNYALADSNRWYAEEKSIINDLYCDAFYKKNKFSDMLEIEGKV